MKMAVTSWESFFEAVKLMRTFQKTPCLASERREVEAIVDQAISSRLARLSADSQMELPWEAKDEND